MPARHVARVAWPAVMALMEVFSVGRATVYRALERALDGA
jgi:hypothetical protein